ncbi:hypothetical protein P3T25_003435 [Paraburkholderia sp. GAS32]
MTAPPPSLWLRIFKKVSLDPVIVRLGKEAFAARKHVNPYPKHTVEHVSWRTGYNEADDWNYVW